MDVGTAAVFSGVVFAVVQYLKNLLPYKWTSDPRVVQTAVFVAGIATTLIAHSPWGTTGPALGMQLLQGIAAAAGAIAIHTGVGAVKNIGQNQPTGPPPAVAPPPPVPPTVVWGVGGNVAPASTTTSAPPDVMTFPAS